MGLAEKQRDPAIAYALAHAGKTLFWTASDIYFAFYLTEVCGLESLVMGLVLAGSYLVNAGADWLLGRLLVARVRTARGAAGLQVAGASLCSATLLLFVLAALAPPSLRLEVCLAALLAFRLSYTLYDIPQNSLLALAGYNERLRARLAGSRLFVSGVARIALTAAFVPLFVQRTTQAQIHAFLILVAIMATLGVASAVALAARFPPGQHERMVAGAVMGARRVSPVRLHLMMMVLSFGTTVFTQLEPFLAAFAMTSRWQGAVLLTAITIGTSLSQPLWMVVGTRLSGYRPMALALAVAAAGAGLFPLLALRSAAAAAIVGALYGTGVGGLFFLLWTSIAQHAADTHGARGATATLGAFAGSAKLGQSTAMLGVGAYLQWLGPSDVSQTGNNFVLVMSGAVLLALFGVTVLAGWMRPLAGMPHDNIRHVS
jgi:Na+/melibiose symporter-like transporter